MNVALIVAVAFFAGWLLCKYSTPIANAARKLSL